MSSGKTWTSTAFWLPSGPGTVVAPTKEPTLMSDSAILTMPTTLMSVVICSLTSSPERDLTERTSPSTPSTVPRTRDGEVCWASAQEHDTASSAKPASEQENTERDKL